MLTILVYNLYCIVNLCAIHTIIFYPVSQLYLLQQPYATAQSEALIHFCDRSAPLPQKEGSWGGMSGLAVGVMCAGDTVKPSGKSFVTFWKRTSTLRLLLASAGPGFMTCGRILEKKELNE